MVAVRLELNEPFQFREDFLNLDQTSGELCPMSLRAQRDLGLCVGLYNLLVRSQLQCEVDRMRR